MKIRSVLFVACGLMMGGAAVGQGCPQGQVGLAVAPASVSPGDPVMISVTGTPGASIILFSGPTSGQTTLSGPGPLAGTTICLAAPFVHVPLGHIPPSGTRTVHLPTPHGAQPGTSLDYQAVTLAPSMGGPVVDTSNTATVSFVAHPPCSAGNVILDIQPDTPVQPGNTISFTVTGTPGAMAVLVRSRHQGSTTLPFGNLTLCLEPPFDVRPLGLIPASGTLTRQHQVPPGAMLPGTHTFWFQVVEVSHGPSGLAFDTSNTDSLTL